MVSKNNFVLTLFIRYLAIIVISINGLFIIYYLTSPVTYFLSLWSLSLIGSVQSFFLEKIIIFNGLSIQLVEACIAGAAYYILLVLCLCTPMSHIKRLKAILLSCGLFMVINIFRIIIFSIIAFNGSNYFDSLHLFSWYFLSIVFVIASWIFTIKVLKIDGTPVYDDVKGLWKIINKK